MIGSFDDWLSLSNVQKKPAAAKALRGVKNLKLNKAANDDADDDKNDGEKDDKTKAKNPEMDIGKASRKLGLLMTSLLRLPTCIKVTDINRALVKKIKAQHREGEKARKEINMVMAKGTEDEPKEPNKIKHGEGFQRLVKDSR